MPDRYYILSKDVGRGQHLVGILDRLAPTEYSFRYCIAGDSFPYFWMRLYAMHDIHKVYGTEDVNKNIMRCFVPPVTDPDYQAMCDTFDISREQAMKMTNWELLEEHINFYDKIRLDKFPLCDAHERMYFYKELPRGVIRHDAR